MALNSRGSLTKGKVVPVRQILAILLLIAAASAAAIQFTEPSGSYAYGSIPVAATFAEGQTLSFELVKDGILLETKTVSSTNTDYKTSFDTTEKGSYVVKATARYNETAYSGEAAFTVTTSKIYITIVKPVETTYSTTVPLELEASQDGSFLHSATVTAKIGGTTTTLPEGQNSYRATATLTPGYQTAVFTVAKGNQSATASVAFTVSGSITEGNETVYVPGPAPLAIKRVSPTSAQYGLGESMELTVYLLDSQNQRVSDATVIAVVKTPAGEEQSIPLVEKKVSGRTVYSNTYIFSQDGFYEAMIKADAPGYIKAEAYMPAIQSGEEAPELPKDVYCQQGLCVRVESPSEVETYPEGSNINMRIQVIEQTTAGPVPDATVTASWAGTETPLEYDWNGYYQNETGNVSAGDYAIVFTVTREGITLTKNATLHVSPDALVIAPIYPAPGSNESNNFVTLQVQVTDPRGEVVTNANVRVMMTTPLTGTHTIPLSRNPSTGYYESEYTFSDQGQHTVKIVASKIGFVSSEAIYTFDVVMPQEGVHITEQDVVIAALIIGVVLIIVTLWKALL